MALSSRGNPVPLIIFIVLFVFSTVGFVLVTVELTKTHEKINQEFKRTPQTARYDTLDGLKHKWQKADQEHTEKALILGKLEDLVGVSEIKDLRGEMKRLKDELDQMVSAEGRASVAAAKTLLSLIRILEKERLVLVERIADMETAHKTETDNLRRRLANEETAVAAKQATIDERDTQIEKLKNTLSEERMIAKQEATTQATQLSNTRTQMQEMREQLQEDIRLDRARIADLEARIEAMKREKGLFKAEARGFDANTEPADGKVILVDKEAGVIIDIGRKKGVRRGLGFDVYLEKSDGTRVKRGKIEIKTVFPEISRGILVGGGDPAQVIYKNDIIVNPAFDPGRAKVFVADTTFDAARKQAFRDALAEYGSVLENDLTVRTDYLILGTQKGKLIEQAQKWGIVLIREDELNAFLGR
ncbi:MAG: hypothetical protein ABIF82_07080 [Planctomycetota bacterium]